MFNTAFSALVAGMLLCAPLAAQTPKLDDLFGQLATAEDAQAGQQVAEAIIAEWSKSGSPAIDLLLQRGQSAIDAGEPGIAIGHFTAAIDHDPAFVEAWHGRATAYYLTGRIGPAIDDLREVLLRNPRHFGALEGFAILLEEMDRPEQALEVWRKVADLHPTHVRAAEAIGRLTLALEGITL